MIAFLALICGSMPAQRTACRDLKAAAKDWLQKTHPGQADVDVAAMKLRECEQRGTSARKQALAALALATGESRQGEATQAAADFKVARQYRPLQDAARFEAGRELLHQGQAALALQPLLYFLRSGRSSPLRSAALLLGAQAAQQIGNWPVFLQFARRLPRTPKMNFLRGEAEEALANSRSAIHDYEQAYFDAPATAAAEQAGRRLLRLWRRLPQYRAGWRLYFMRGTRLLWAGQAATAGATLQYGRSLAPAADRWRFELPLAEAEFAQHHYLDVRRSLPALFREQPAQAEWLKLRLELKDNRLTTAKTSLARLRNIHGGTELYARALVTLADTELNQGDLPGAEHWFDSYEAHFPHSPFASSAAWRAAWIAYRRGQPDAQERLQRLLIHYPHAANAGDALYWLGRIAEKRNEKALAAACFRAAATRYPETYFGYESALRARHLRVADPARLPDYFYHLLLPRSAPRIHPIPPAAREAWRRSHWLSSAWLKDAAVRLLMPQFWRYPHSLMLAETLSRWEAQRQDYAASMRMLQAAVAQPERLAISQLPLSAWRRLYPEPYAAEIQSAARRFAFKPTLLLGLIRQESGFNARSLSSARARGLMQLELTTARSHERQAGRQQIAAADLYSPGLNLFLGTAELAKLRNRFHYNLAYMLAAYNAGPHAVERWLNRDPPHSQPYFIESIPYVQTRHYVQAVLSNIRMYAHLYRWQPRQRFNAPIQGETTASRRIPLFHK